MLQHPSDLETKLTMKTASRSVAALAVLGKLRAHHRGKRLQAEKLTHSLQAPAPAYQLPYSATASTTTMYAIDNVHNIKISAYRNVLVQGIWDDSTNMIYPT